MARNHNASHKELFLKTGDLVGLATKNLRLKGDNRKLHSRRIGPFRILQPVGTQAYRIALPQEYSRMHNVFHVSPLEPWSLRGGDDNSTLPMPDLETRAPTRNERSSPRAEPVPFAGWLAVVVPPELGCGLKRRQPVTTTYNEPTRVCSSRPAKDSRSRSRSHRSSHPS
jgi:hypothetical protein